MQLGEADRGEHLPWVRAGFAVAAFEVDGHLPDNPSNVETAAAIDAFRAARGGIDDAIAAFNYAASRPEIDMNRIYIVGHSSAATLALQVAEHEPRIAGCVAFAPACDVAGRLAKAAAFLDDLRPGTMQFLADYSPDRNVRALNCPTLLFTARDDTNVPSASVLAFAATLHARNPQVTTITVETGGHTLSMLSQGIPAGIAFLKSLSDGTRP
jgi:dienelactone hydrolase